MTKYVAPALDGNSFTCPFCGVLSQQSWIECYINAGGRLHTVPVKRCWCVNCHEISWWSTDSRRQIEPRATAAPMPHEDLPAACKDDYMEARNVAAESPRSAAALLRLCVQRLLVELGGAGKSIDDDIAKLVQQGLPVQVKSALDICRVVGNNAVHPGELDVKDDSSLVAQLFELINFIVAQTIERQKNIDAMLGKLPKGALDAIAKRDARALSANAAASPVPRGGS